MLKEIKLQLFSNRTELLSIAIVDCVQFFVLSLKHKLIVLIRIDAMAGLTQHFISMLLHFSIEPREREIEKKKCISAPRQVTLFSRSNNKHYNERFLRSSFHTNSVIQKILQTKTPLNNRNGAILIHSKFMCIEYSFQFKHFTPLSLRQRIFQWWPIIILWLKI